MSAESDVVYEVMYRSMKYDCLPLSDRIGPSHGEEEYRRQLLGTTRLEIAWGIFSSRSLSMTGFLMRLSRSARTEARVWSYSSESRP